MQLHQLKPIHKAIKSKRVGRGGKRGTFSGRGSKGQKSRAGTRIRPGFRGGNEPLWKIFPKQRGATKKIAIRSGLFHVTHKKGAVVNLETLEQSFENGARVTGETLVKKGLIKTAQHGVKVLGTGELKKKLIFGEDVTFSKSAHDKTR